MPGIFFGNNLKISYFSIVILLFGNIEWIMNKIPKIMMIIMLMIITAAQAEPDNGKCFKCHASPTLKEIDEETGVTRNLYVDPLAFKGSNHGRLQCTFCHGNSHDSWPHSKSAAVDLTCITCHSANSTFLHNNMQFSEKFDGIPIGKIYDEFQQNYHVKKLGDKFNCFSCHDPHSFQRNFTDRAQKIVADNAMCLHCHASTSNLKMLTARKFDNIENIHAWLPNPELHWKNVRCIDCHSSYNAPNLSHNILPKDKAVKNCEKCHSQNTILMTKLYKYESKKEKEKSGFVNGSILNKSYVIGSTRNSYLDKISIIIFAGMFIFIGIHGGIRLLTKKKNNYKK